MKLRMSLLLLMLSLVSCGYSPSSEEISNAIDSTLKIKSPVDFEIISSSSSSSVSGYIEEFEIRYSSDSLKELMLQLDMTSWVKVENGFQYSMSNINGSGVIISLDKANLRYQFGEQ